MHSLNVSLKHFQKYQIRIRTKKQWFSAVVSRSHWKAPFCYELALTVTSCFACTKTRFVYAITNFVQWVTSFPALPREGKQSPRPAIFLSRLFAFLSSSSCTILVFFRVPEDDFGNTVHWH